MEWDQAIKEAYASATGIILSTLEINHETWDEPVRLVHDHADLNAKNESGEVVEFSKCAFLFTHPESTGKLPTMALAVDNVSSELTEPLFDSMQSRAAITQIYREFLADDPLEGPHYVMPGMSFKNITLTESRVSGEATFFDFFQRAAPNSVFEANEYPGLLR